jgi:DNA-binding transcriptional LysR family regulator
MGLEPRLFGPGDLAHLPIITNPEPSNLYENISSWFETERVQPTRLNTCNSLTIMTKLAVAGVGVSLLPTAILRGELGAGLLQVLATAPAIAPHPLAVAYRRDYRGSGLRMVADVVSQLVASSDLGSEPIGLHMADTEAAQWMRPGNQAPPQICRWQADKPGASP